MTRVFPRPIASQHHVKMGDVVVLSTSKASELNLFTSSWFRRNHAEMWPSRLPPSRLAQEMAGSEDGDWIIE